MLYAHSGQHSAFCVLTKYNASNNVVFQDRYVPSDRPNIREAFQQWFQFGLFFEDFMLYGPKIRTFRWLALDA